MHMWVDVNGVVHVLFIFRTHAQTLQEGLTKREQEVAKLKVQLMHFQSEDGRMLEGFGRGNGQTSVPTRLRVRFPSARVYHPVHQKQQMLAPEVVPQQPKVP